MVNDHSDAYSICELICICCRCKPRMGGSYKNGKLDHVGHYDLVHAHWSIIYPLYFMGITKKRKQVQRICNQDLIFFTGAAISYSNGLAKKQGIQGLGKNVFFLFHFTALVARVF